MTTRPATVDDEAVLRELWEAFEAEVPEADGFRPETWEEEWADVSRHIAEGVVLLHEDEEGAAGYVRFGPPEHGRAHVASAYVRPRARRRGVMRKLVHSATAELRARGVEWLSLDVLSRNAGAIATWSAIGFEEVRKEMAAPLATVEALTAEREAGEWFASIHVQTDDRAGVERQVEKYLPRIGHSGGTEISQPRNGWVAVYDQLCDQDRESRHRLAHELSYAVGAIVLAIAVEDGAVVRYALFDRGAVVDEYLSVPEYHGPLPPGDVVALAANSTVVGRLTGADPSRVRAVARTASSPAELPPARELLAQIAEAIGVEGTEHGWAGRDLGSKA